MKSVARWLVAWLRSWHLSLFEKVILLNSLMLIGEALAGVWVTSHNIEVHHYLIDTSFIVIAMLLMLFINAFLLRASFRPLFHLLATIRAISAGDVRARATGASSSAEINELAQAFNGMLDRLEAVRQEQTLLIFQAQEEERRRIALELHDETGQNLTALLIHIEVLSQRLQSLPDTSIATTTQQLLEKELQQLTGLTQQTLENIRLLAQQLRPAVLDDLGLLAAFRWLVEDSSQRLQLEVTLETAGIGEEQQLPPMYETALFRITQESLTNITRHAHTRQAAISLKRRDGSIELTIRDQGCGCDLATLQKGSGIVGMRERASLLKGTLTFQSQPEQGTTVQVVLPLPAEATRSTPVKDQVYVQ